MKKLIIILFLISSSVFAQDTCYQYVIRNMDFSKIDTVKYLCDTVHTTFQGKPLDSCKHKNLTEYSVYYESGKRVFYCLDCKKDIVIYPKTMQGKPLAITDTTEIINELMQVQKTYQEVYKEKVKALETSDTDLLRIQGIILYLNQKLEIERKKK